MTGLHRTSFAGERYLYLATVFFVIWLIILFISIMIIIIVVLALIKKRKKHAEDDSKPDQLVTAEPSPLTGSQDASCQQWSGFDPNPT